MTGEKLLSDRLSLRRVILSGAIAQSNLSEAKATVPAPLESRRTKPHSLLPDGYNLQLTLKEVIPMPVTDGRQKKALDAILHYMKSVDFATRREILDGALSEYGFSEEARKNPDPASKYNTARSDIGTVLNQLIQEKELLRVGISYALAKDEPVIVKEVQCRQQMLHLLKKKSYTRRELFTALDRAFGTDLTRVTTDDAALHSLAGQILSDLVQKGDVVCNDGKYACADTSRTSSALAERTPLPAESFKPLLMERLHRAGGSFFEHFLANTLEKYFLITGRTVLNCDVIGGSNDGGIDILIETVEQLGFVEHIAVQAKCRERAQVTEKEIREFYGAMNAKGASRGIYATTSSFHPGAQKLLDSLDNCVGLDGDRLFEIIRMTAYGIHITKAGFSLDRTIFDR